MRTITALLLTLSLGCATYKPPAYDMTRDVDGNPIWTVHVDPPAPAGRSYALVYAALTLATIADVESTFRGLDRCPSCREGNPILSLFVDRGRGATYAVLIGWNAFQMEIARRMKRQHQRTWALAPSIGIGIHSLAAASNSGQ